MKKLIYFVCLAFAGIFLLGCEKNDMPEPEKPREEEPADSTDIVDPEEPDTIVEQKDDPENGIILDMPGITLKGWVHCNRVGMPGVVVTDGTNVTVTDEKGIYGMKRNTAASHVYISSPSGYTVCVKNSVPQFYAEINQRTDIVHKDFELVRLETDDTKHTFIAIGDPQLYRDFELSYLKEAVNDLNSWVTQSRKGECVHYIVLGDLVFDKPEYHESSKEIFSMLNAPVYNVIGNHDHVFDKSEPAMKSNDLKADTVYKRHYGPTYYSYNRGKVHYVVLDDVEYWGGSGPKYVDAVSDEQIAWLQKDLMYVDKDKAIVLCLHAPTKRRTETRSFGNREQLYALLRGYADVQILSGHTHWNSVVTDDGSGMTEHIVAAMCGNWWQPELICSEGTPIGYKIFDVDGTSFKWKYKCVGQPEQYQMRVYPLGERINILRPKNVVLNVWDWDPSWKVEYSEDNGQNYRSMFRSLNMYDITAYNAFGAKGDNTFPVGRTWIQASESDHMFYCRPSIPYNQLKIRVTSRFGDMFSTTVNIQNL